MRRSHAVELATGEIFEDAESTASLSLAPITRALGGTYSLLFRAGSDGNVADALCFGVDTGYVRRLKEAACHRLLPGWLKGLAVGSVVDRAAFGSDHQFSRTEFCNHVVRPEGDFHCVIATPLAWDRDRYHLVVGRPRRHREFDADNRHLMQLMLPQVAEILRLRIDLAATRDHMLRIETTLDGLDQPLLVVRRDGLIVSANRPGRRLLALRESLWSDAKGRVSATTPVDTGLLRGVIRQTGDQGGRTTVLVPSAFGGTPVRLMLSRLDPSDLSDAALQRSEILIMADPDDGRAHEDRIDAMGRSYGLTRREVALVSHLARGRNLKDASRDLNMAYNTARSYLRQIFDKTDVHRQSDLMRLFMSGLRPEQGGNR